MREIGFYARGDSFYGGVAGGDHDRYERTVRHCRLCGWWLINMGHMAHSDDEFAWSRNETIYVQGVLAQFDVATVQAGLAAVAGHLKATRQQLSDINATELSALIGRFLPAKARGFTLRRIASREREGMELMLLRSALGSWLIHVKRSVPGSEWESLAAVRTLNGVLIADDAPNGVVVTTSRPVSALEPQSDWEDHNAPTPSGFYRHDFEDVDLSAVFELVEGRDVASPAFVQHMAPATFELGRAGSRSSPTNASDVFQHQLLRPCISTAMRHQSSQH